MSDTKCRSGTRGLTEALAVAAGDAAPAPALPRLTPAQRRALLWLPADGSWRWRAPREVSSAVSSLWRQHRDLCTREWRGDPGGDGVLNYRLTPAGQALRAQIERDGI